MNRILVGSALFLVTATPAFAGSLKGTQSGANALTRGYTALWVGASLKAKASYDRGAPVKGKLIVKAGPGEIVKTRAGDIHMNFVDAEARQNGVVSRTLGKNPVAPKLGDQRIDAQAAVAYTAVLDQGDGSIVRMDHAPPRTGEMSKFTLPDTVSQGAGAYGGNVVIKNELYIDFKTNTAYAKRVDTYSRPDGSAFSWVKIGAPLEFAK